MKLMIFHLPRDIERPAVLALLVSCGVSAQTLASGPVVALHVAPGDTREAYAIVDGLPDGMRASGLPERLSARRLGHRPVWAWVPHMAWR